MGFSAACCRDPRDSLCSCSLMDFIHKLQVLIYPPDSCSVLEKNYWILSSIWNWTKVFLLVLINTLEQRREQKFCINFIFSKLFTLIKLLWINLKWISAEHDYFFLYPIETKLMFEYSNLSKCQQINPDSIYSEFRL